MADYPPSLARFAWLSIAAAVVTIGLKAGAYRLTGSVGLLSDALESMVNLVAAVIALIALTVAARLPTEEHAYGFEKAEYFSSGAEGALILVAAIGIVVSAVPRLFSPRTIDAPVAGLAVSTVASLINLGVSLRLQRAGREQQSITLEADARHLMTDVWTSAGVLAGVAAVTLTGWARLDPIIALAVAANIVWTGGRLVWRSLRGLLDRAVPPNERAAVQRVLDRYRQEYGVEIHAPRTRQAGARRFVSFHVLVPGAWTVKQGHDLIEDIEQDIRGALSRVTVFTHLEPLEDPTSYEDTTLDRMAPRRARADP
jgi:cation diffusion facilitator family transporter